MPYVHIELIGGRSQEQKDALAKDIIESVIKHTGVPRKHVHVIFQDMKPENHYSED
ncbi:MAG TPA: 2-hydroxymuconate tautomerase [Lactovum miscens]|uniref:2-hydroxymuconate tautomerase n=1 Tax=Lactovum miscens TaxID=190387 RepID=UPI002ED7D313